MPFNRKAVQLPVAISYAISSRGDGCLISEAAIIPQLLGIKRSTLRGAAIPILWLVLAGRSVSATTIAATVGSHRKRCL